MALTFEQEMDLERLKQAQKVEFEKLKAEIADKEHAQKMERLKMQLEIAKASGVIQNDFNT